MRNILIKSHNIKDTNNLNMIEVEELFEKLETGRFLHCLTTI